MFSLSTQVRPHNQWPMFTQNSHQVEYAQTKYYLHDKEAKGQ